MTAFPESGRQVQDSPRVATRFAPSPTGRLHLGHAASALLAFDSARAAGGRFLLRIEDIDAGRSRPEHVAGIIEDLAWLGIAWDEEPLLQSTRLPAYAAALERLRALGLLYPCFCTRAEVTAEIAASASAPHGPDGPIYPGTCRRLDPAIRSARLGAEPHAWRLDMAAATARFGPLTWHDRYRGPIAADPAPAGDVVLSRKDAPASYHLAATLDDAWTGITLVVRGDDLFAATHVHRLLQALLGLPNPDYAHHPLLTDANGHRLAKRNGAMSLVDMRARGADPAALRDALRQWAAHP